MLRTLKWTYELGVKHERQRIARALEAQANMLRHEIEVTGVMIQNYKDPNVKNARKRRLEFKQAVTARVKDIVDEIFTPQHEYSSYFSLMFPDEEKRSN